MEGELRDLRQLLTSIDQRLRTLENATPRARAVEARPEPVRLQPQPVPAQPSFQQVSFPKYVEQKSRLGTPFAIISFACFFLAAAYIIRLVWEVGWFTPERQVIVAAGLGISLIIFGLRQRYSESEYASGLAGTGAVILQMTVFGGHLYYEIINLPVAVAGSLIVSLFTIELYTVFNSLFYLVFSCVSTYAIPFVLHRAGVDLPAVGSFHLVWALLFSFLAVKIKNRELHGFASFCGLLVFAIIALQSQTISYFFLKEESFNEKSAVLLTFVLFQSLQFMVFAIGAVYHTATLKKSMTATQANYYLLPLLIFYCTEYSALRQLEPDFAPWIAVAFVVFLLGLYSLGKKFVQNSNLESLGIVQVFAAIVFVHAVYFEACAEEFRPWLFLGILGLASIPALRPTVKQLFSRVPIIILFIVLFAYNSLHLFFHNLKGSGAGHITFASMLFVLAMLAMYFGSRKEKGPQFFELLPFIAHIQALSALYNILRDAGTLAVTFAWGVYAAVVLGLAFKTFDRSLGKTSVIVLGAAAGKALFYDIGIKGGATTVGVLITTGIVLYAGAQLLNKVDQIPSRKN